MTQGLRNLLNLPLMEDVLRTAGVVSDTDPTHDPLGDDPLADDALGDHPADGASVPTDPALLQAIAQAAQARAQLDMVGGQDHADAMDKLHKETLKHAQDLMDLGFNIDLPRARGIFEVATNMYSRSIEAKNAKRDAELKAMRLALEQRKLDLIEQKMNAQLGTLTSSAAPAPTATIREDRNELIKRLRAERGADKP